MPGPDQSINAAWAGYDGYTALMFASRLSHADGVRKLLAAGADPNVKNHDGETALHLALRCLCGPNIETIQAQRRRNRADRARGRSECHGQQRPNRPGSSNTIGPPGRSANPEECGQFAVTPCLACCLLPIAYCLPLGTRDRNFSFPWIPARNRYSGPPTNTFSGS